MGKFDLRRLRLATLAALSAAAITVTAAPVAAQASPGPLAGGGCLTGGSPWNVGVCSSDNGVTVFGDLYINSRGSLGSSCYTYYRLLDTTTGNWVANSGNQDSTSATTRTSPPRSYRATVTATTDTSTSTASMSSMVSARTPSDGSQLGTCAECEPDVSPDG
ncbi:hypothetical protein ONA70_02300 [Micromonospora yasonensis]|uniref:hypothetical protein n=1 Tax=Micromonospora yasonensis TaxID=1128667 RepID=UPI002231F099|nr:hypothetical protein [Micromonospora yasonensis]MCW3838926.1 hypothetical protein [Micromonospora yasonensis]